MTSTTVPLQLTIWGGHPLPARVCTLCDTVDQGVQVRHTRILFIALGCVHRGLRVGSRGPFYARFSMRALSKSQLYTGRPIRLLYRFHRAQHNRTLAVLHRGRCTRHCCQPRSDYACDACLVPAGLLRARVECVRHGVDAACVQHLFVRRLGCMQE